MKIDWNRIRSINGGQYKGFEELCAQLARAESPPESKFVRKGTPDAGVECYAVLEDGAEWGWQAKFFNQLANSQWSQIDKSIKTALLKHPKLVRYFVCVPLDLADARIEGQKSAADRWEEHLSKWNGWETGRRSKVEFIYWGSHELFERLSRPEHIGRFKFWFDARGFDPGWFKQKLEEALKTAGPRYTPEIHVDLSIMSDFEAFGRTKNFINQEKARALEIRKKIEVIEDRGNTGTSIDCVALTTVLNKVQTVLTSIGKIEASAIGPFVFNTISEEIKTAIEAAQKLLQHLSEQERKLEAKSEAKSKGTNVQRASYMDDLTLRYWVRVKNLIIVLSKTREAFENADKIASSSLIVLRGNAGVGKTHLLCKLAQQRLSTNRPTVLLMGQRFLNDDEPWSQALKQLDLSNLSIEEFIGMLETVAQTYDSRALVIIDAINEGNCRNIWFNHLTAFLKYLEHSKWIGVVLSVRSSFEEMVIPDNVRSQAVILEHLGFTECEYDAMKTFFDYYGLELPSIPDFVPELFNPLFLKILCQGLKTNGKRRLSRGFHGITDVFDLYLKGVHDRLARTLDFHPRTSLVRQAVTEVAKVIADAIIVDPINYYPSLTKAEEVVNGFLPNRDFGRSLYKGLVDEGILIENENTGQDENSEIFVTFGYERLADHLVAKNLLDRYLVKNDPASAFAAKEGLAFICDNKNYISPGLLEALCIQIPERTGKELVSIAPICVEQMGIGDAFRQSVIWRKPESFMDDTLRVLFKFCRSEDDWNNIYDVFLTLATLSEHPLNAMFLDWFLRKDAMPDRDKRWISYLHFTYGSQGPVDRLVDWAFSMDPKTSIDDEVVDLCAITLSWMFATSNRFLRDRATIALVNLLTGRLKAVIRLIEQFGDVDDVYVVERVYAVAYGVAMSCHDPKLVGSLATHVYKRVFVSGSPPPHILLRDYARGVVERALHLDPNIDVDPNLIRPPYKSTWPTVPTEEDIKKLLLDRSKGSNENDRIKLALDRIVSSVMESDFARYVIGTNSSNSSWLSLKLKEPQWKPPSRCEGPLLSLVDEFSADERTAWEKFKTAEPMYMLILSLCSPDWIAQRDKINTLENFDFVDSKILMQHFEKENSSEVDAFDENAKRAIVVLKAVLTEEHWQRLIQIRFAQAKDYKSRHSSRFDLSKIQRYVLGRVFELGWSIERFGVFDSFSYKYQGRSASKAERIGKKYQWIAYHEIMALIADHYQYYDKYREQEGNQAYVGPWQDYFRDIDPSCTLRPLSDGMSFDGHPVSWWAPVRYDLWEDPANPRDWILDNKELPKVEDLLVVTNSKDESIWVNGQSFFSWNQRPPANLGSTDIEQRDLWYICIGYLVQANDAKSFMHWAESIDFMGRWMPEAVDNRTMFLGEHAWAPASHHFQQSYYGDNGWTQPDHDCPVRVRTVTCQYTSKISDFDCSIEQSQTLHLPVIHLVRGLGIRWSGHGADFIDDMGRIAAQDPTVHSEGPSSTLFRYDLLSEFLAREKLAFCWAVLGEKRVIPSKYETKTDHPRLSMSGAYVLSEKHAEGFLNLMSNDRNGENGSATESRLIRTVKTSGYNV